MKYVFKYPHIQMFGLNMSNFTHLMLCLANATHNSKMVEI